MKRFGLRGLGACATAGALTLLTGCPGFFVYPGSTASGTGTTTGDYVYVGNVTAKTLSGFAVGTGTLTAVSNSPYSLTVTPTAVAVNPSDTIVYVGSLGLVYAYAIGSGGALTIMNNGYAVASVNATAMDISPDGQWLFVLDTAGFAVDEFQINNTTGALTQQAGATYSITNATVVPHAIKVSPTGTFVFAALGTAGDIVFTLNTTSGALANSQELLFCPASQTTTCTATTSDNGLTVGETGNYLYIARSGTGGGLAVYTITAGSGALTAVAGSPFAAGNQPYAVAANNTETEVYVANRSDSTISGYSVASGGVLTALSGSPYTSGSGVSALAADKSGSYLLAVASGGAPDLTLYTVDSATAGKLDLTTTSATGTDPTGATALALTH